MQDGVLGGGGRRAQGSGCCTEGVLCLRRVQAAVPDGTGGSSRLPLSPPRAG